MKHKMLAVCCILLILFAQTSVYAEADVSGGQTVTPAQAALNGAARSPSATGFARMDEKVQEILRTCGYGTLSTYEVVKNCYDYLIETVSYRTDGYMAQEGYPFADRQAGIECTVDEFMVDLAYAPLFLGKGVCNEYAGAFILLTRAIGLESYYYIGQTQAAAGGFLPHAWVEIRIGGVDYVFDPQVDDNIARGGEIRYLYFCKPESEMQDKYLWDWEQTNAAKAKFKPLPATPAIRVTLDGQELWFTQPPVIEDDRVLVPVRAIFEPLGAALSWDGAAQSITAGGKGVVLALKVGVPVMTRNGEEIALDVPPKLINGHTMVPVRAVTEGFGAQVVWNPADRTVVITSAAAQ